MKRRRQRRQRKNGRQYSRGERESVTETIRILALHFCIDTRPFRAFLFIEIPSLHSRGPREPPLAARTRGAKRMISGECVRRKFAYPR